MIGLHARRLRQLYRRSLQPRRSCSHRNRTRGLSGEGLLPAPPRHHGHRYPQRQNEREFHHLLPSQSVRQSLLYWLGSLSLRVLRRYPRKDWRRVANFQEAARFSGAGLRWQSESYRHVSDCHSL